METLLSAFVGSCFGGAGVVLALVVVAYVFGQNKQEAK